MKTLYLLLATVCAACILTGCDKIEHENDFDKSYKAWQTFKSESGDTYQYKTSPMQWESSSTIISVRNGQVVQREYELLKPENPDLNITSAYIIAEHWIEDEHAIGSHEARADALTLEQVYDKAKKEWLIKGNHSMFNGENNGMISYCGYWAGGCDPFFIGISIEWIQNWSPE